MNKGDILIIKYRLDPIGWLIRRFTHSQWNHIAWVIDRKHLIESLGRGIIINPINKYNNKFLFKVEILRIRDITKKDLNKAIKWAKTKVKKTNNYFRLLLSFFIITIGYPYKSLPLTCSGLIATALSQVNWYFKKNKSPIKITPADIASSKKLKRRGNEIKYRNSYTLL